MTVRLIVEAEQATPAGTPEAIQAVAESEGVDIEGLDMDQLVMGVAVEYEHGSKNGDDVNVTKDEDGPALKIAVAHLREIPDYYTRLVDMEAAAKAEVAEPDEDMREEETNGEEEQRESRGHKSIKIERAVRKTVEGVLSALNTLRTQNPVGYDKVVEAWRDTVPHTGQFDVLSGPKFEQWLQKQYAEWLENGKQDIDNFEVLWTDVISLLPK